MAKIIIDIKQLSKNGAFFTPKGMTIPTTAKVRVETEENEAVASIIAHKIAKVYDANLEMALKSACASIISEFEESFKK